MHGKAKFVCFINMQPQKTKFKFVQINISRKLQPSLSERVIVDGHGCHTALHFGFKAKENQDKVPTLYWLPKLHKNPIKQDLLLILVLVRQQRVALPHGATGLSAVCDCGIS